MDPVNPAPAGNPQLTTHLLVSHKKNKNFHPSKVSLKRVNFVTKQTPLPKGVVPHAEILPGFVAKIWARNKNRLRVVDIIPAQDLSKCGSWMSEALHDHPCMIYIKICFNKLKADQTDEIDSEHVFTDLNFVLKLMDWDGSELVHLTEKDVNLEKLTETMIHWAESCSRTDLFKSESIEFRLSWNEIGVKIGESNMRVLRDDQPINESTDSEVFFRRYRSLVYSWGEDMTAELMLDSVVGGLNGTTPFESLNRCNNRVSHYIEYLSKQAQAASELSPNLKSLIQQMVQKLVYWTQPFIKSIVEPALDDLESFKHGELAVKMGDIFERLVTHQTLDSSESLKELESCLHCDWNEMLRLLVLNNWEFYEKHLQTFLASTDSQTIELKRRLYNQRGYPILKLTKKFIKTLDPQSQEPERKTEEEDLSAYQLQQMSHRYQCFSSETALAIRLVPNQLLETGFHLQKPCKHINLGLEPMNQTSRILISDSTLMVVKGERSVYLCDLSTVMNGPSEQNLSQVSRLFEIEDKEVDFTGGNLVALGKNNLVILRQVDQTTYLDWFHFKMDAIHIEGEIARFSQPESTEVEGELPDPYNLSYKILPNNMLALGVAEDPLRERCEGRDSESIMLMMFQYNHVTNQVVRLAKQTIEIDSCFLSQLPCSTTQNEEIKLNFGICKGRIFCVAQIHSEKPVLQVFCYYRNKFQPIGGTNCRRTGVYVMDRNTKVGLDPQSSMPSFDYPNEGLKELYVTSGKVDYDFKQRLATFKFCEWALRF